MYLIFWCYFSTLCGLYSYFPSVFYIDVIHICKNKNLCGIYKKTKKNLVTFWGYTDNSNKELIYPYTLLYIIIFLTYRKKKLSFIHNWGLPCNNSMGAWGHLLSLFSSFLIKIRNFRQTKICRCRGSKTAQNWSSKLFSAMRIFPKKKLKTKNFETEN